MTSIRENPELAVFLTLAIGFAVGRLRFGGFALGNVVGTLLAGVVVGQIGVKVDPLVKVVFFDLFLFATGYKVGPQFFRGRIVGAAGDVERAGRALGYLERPSSETDLRGRGHRHRGPARDPGRGGQQGPRAGVHRALRERQHPAHRVGPRHRDADAIGGAPW